MAAREWLVIDDDLAEVLHVFDVIRTLTDTEVYRVSPTGQRQDEDDVRDLSLTERYQDYHIDTIGFADGLLGLVDQAIVPGVDQVNVLVDLVLNEKERWVIKNERQGYGRFLPFTARAIIGILLDRPDTAGVFVTTRFLDMDRATVADRLRLADLGSPLDTDRVNWARPDVFRLPVEPQDWQIRLLTEEPLTLTRTLQPA